MLYNDEYAVVSLGISCQTAGQIKANKSLFEEKFHSKLEYSSSFFNWILTDPRFIGKTISTFSKRAITRDDVALSPHLQGRNVPYLPESACWLWHEDGQEGVYSERDMENVVSKYNYLFQKFMKIRPIKNRVFVFGGADYNTRAFPMWSDDMYVPHFRNSDIYNLIKTINEIFPEGKNIFVYAAPVTAGFVTDENLYFGRVGIDNTAFGHYADWQRLLSRVSFDHTARERELDNLKEDMRDVRQDLYFSASSEAIKVSDDENVYRCEDGYIKINPGQGVALYGPYIRLLPGYYKVIIEFDGSDIEGETEVDVVFNYAQNFIWKKRFSASNVKSSVGAFVTMNFFVGKADGFDDVEVRIFASESFSAKFKSLTFKLINDL